ncbi:MAG TPA: endonuclease/exonuclease/phosphatase family protein [Solirubrobacteraceae bacterium]|nr:endonuclease/exonuclease/phosphatase family protein [Solirubrobacteraceae bacterium]
MLRVLTWNLFHGRAVPDQPRPLLGEFARRIAGWEWDVALLQEVLPWWPAPLAAAAGAQERHVLTSRNALLPLRRLLADRRPDLIRSNGGGANAILVRGGRIEEHRTCRLRVWPERRRVHAVRLATGTWVANVHAQGGGEERARSDTAKAAAAVLEWAGGAPCVLGGDFNTHRPEAQGFVPAGGNDVDHVLANGMVPLAPPRVADHAPLSDHAPVLATLGTNPGGATSEGA